MKSYTDHYKKCDQILQNVCGTQELHDANMDFHLAEKENEKRGLLKALEADGYIEWPNKDNFWIRATIKGYQFWRDDGFEQKFKEEQDEKNKNNLLRKSSIITMWVAIGIGIISMVTAIQTCILTSQQKSSHNTLMKKEEESYKSKTSLSEKDEALSAKQKPIDSTNDAKLKDTSVIKSAKKP